MHNACHNVQRYNDAVQCFNTAQRLDKTKPEVFFFLGHAQYKLGRSDEAMAAVRTAITLKKEEGMLSPFFLCVFSLAASLHH